MIPSLMKTGHYKQRVARRITAEWSVWLITPLILWEDFLAAKEPQVRLGSEMRAYPWGYPGHCVWQNWLLSPQSRSTCVFCGSKAVCLRVWHVSGFGFVGDLLTATMFLSRFLKIVTALRSWPPFWGEELDGPHGTGIQLLAPASLSGPLHNLVRHLWTCTCARTHYA